MQDALAAGRQGELERQQLLNELAASQVQSAAARGHACLATQTDVLSAATQATAEAAESAAPGWPRRIHCSRLERRAAKASAG